MSTPNKYHPTGRLYTAREYADRRRALTPVYLVLHPLVGRACQPHDTGRNAKKRMARTLGYKSLKQWDRVLERRAQF